MGTFVPEKLEEKGGAHMFLIMGRPLSSMKEEIIREFLDIVSEKSFLFIVEEKNILFVAHHVITE